MFPFDRREKTRNFRDANYKAHQNSSRFPLKIDDVVNIIAWKFVEVLSTLKGTSDCVVSTENLTENERSKMAKTWTTKHEPEVQTICIEVSKLKCLSDNLPLFV